MKIRTPEIAERLARSFEAQSGYQVKRMIEQRPVVSTRSQGTVILATRVYAAVYKGSVHRMNITYETIDERSVIW